MDNTNVYAVCTSAAELIKKDGWQRGAAGWMGMGGWCLEGALGRVMGMVPPLSLDHNEYSQRINASPAGQAIAAYLNLDKALCYWNDTDARMVMFNGVVVIEVPGRTQEDVVQTLLAVARRHRPEVEIEVPVALPVPVGSPKPTLSFTIQPDGQVHLASVQAEVEAEIEDLLTEASETDERALVTV